MPRIELLDPGQHRDIRIRTDQGSRLLQGTNLLPVLASELQHLAVEFPVCLIKSPESGQFGLFALLGFRAGENLMLDQDENWKCHYIPLDIRRRPFLVVPGQEAGTGTMAIDVEHPMVSRDEGEALFDEGGNATFLMDDFQSVLSTVMSGIGPTRAFVEALDEHNLLAPARIDVAGEGESFALDGFYTVNARSIEALDANTLSSLNRNGSLFAAHLIVASMANVDKLLAKRPSA
ncbi:SapC family protein [Tsuneonella mangrovi]|uniref:SapC family protein n=1 Tax=Tsuneonella mangrovi TaxID=1982042 RepID=UPI0014725FFD|nr:SapC family protein [Tsuneonella mangrovi]